MKTVTLVVSVTGVNHIAVKVDGTGFMSNIVRLFMNGLNSKNELNQVSSNLGMVQILFYAFL